MKVHESKLRKVFTKDDSRSWIEFGISSKCPNWENIVVIGAVNTTCLVEHSCDTLLCMGERKREKREGGKEKKQEEIMQCRMRGIKT